MQQSPLPQTAASAPTYDDSEWPLFVVTMPPVALSAADFQGHLEYCSKVFRRGQPFCFVIDMGQHPPMPPLQRKAIGHTMQADAAKYPGLMVGCALVVRSTVLRGIVTAITWIARPPYPTAAFENLPAAKAWAARLLTPSAQP